MEAIQATRRPKRRSPRTYDGGRICVADGCGTIVSRYNNSDHCNTHRPTRFPRVRGA